MFRKALLKILCVSFILGSAPNFLLAQMGEGEDPPCEYITSPSSFNLTYAAATKSVNITNISGNSCLWNLTKTVSWISLSKTVGSGSTSFTFTCTQNNSTASRTGYIRLSTVTDVYVISVTQGGLPSPPATPGVPSGKSAVCPGETTTYGISPVSGATYYRWVAPAGASISGQGSTNVSITFGSTGGNVSVRAENVAGVSSYRSKNVTINTIPSITGHPSNRTVCSGSSALFQVNASGTGLSYQWQYSSNGINYYNCVTGFGINTANFTETSTTGKNGYKYRCIVSGTCGPSVTSNSATLTFNTAPSITSHPSGRTVCSGTNASFSVSATGTGLSYQWQYSSNGINYYDCVTGTGINTANFTETSTAGKNGYRYRCVVSGICNLTATSSSATLTLNTAPSITGHPSNRAVCSGSNASFSVSATGTGLSYQWQYSSNGTNYYNCVTGTGINTANFTETSTAGKNGYKYRCIVSGTCSPGATSNSATLTVNTSPSITGHPSNRTVCSGSSASFSVSATGTGLSYQWQYSSNGIHYYNCLTGFGINTANYTETSTEGKSGYKYRCVVSGTCGPSVTSNSATLTFNTAPSINSHPSGQAVCPGSNASFSVSATGAGLSYQWQYSSNGIHYYNCETGTGINTANYTETNTAGKSGYRYRCIVSGICSLTAISSSAVLTLKTVPDQPGAIQGETYVCAELPKNYSVQPVTGVTYNWDLPNGWSGSSTSNLITATPGLTGGNITVTSGNECGSGVSQTLFVDVYSTPPAPVFDEFIYNDGTTTARVLSASGVTFFWQTTADGQSTGHSGLSYTTATTGTMFVRARLDENPNFWSDALPVDINIYTTPPVPDQAQTVYDGEYITLVLPTVSSGYTVYWQETETGTSTSDSTSPRIVAVSGTYFYRVRHNISGLWGDTQQISVTVHDVLYAVKSGSWTDPTVWGATENGPAVHILPNKYTKVIIKGYQITLSEDKNSGDIELLAKPGSISGLLINNGILTLYGEISVEENDSENKAWLQIIVPGKLNCVEKE